MSIKRATKIYMSDRITERDLGDEIIVMKHMDSEHHSFKDTAQELWRKIHENVTAGDLLSFMINEYDVDEETAWDDLAEFLAELKDKQLVVF